MFSQNTKFLVVDDFLTMRKIIKKALNENGYFDIIEAENGTQALKMLQESFINNKPIEFIISDWNMPNMNGLDLLKECRQNSMYKDIPFLMVTAESEQKQIIEAIKLGVSEYIVKPFSPSTIIEKLSRVYNRINEGQKIA